MAEGGDGPAGGGRQRRRRGLLKLYYGTGEDSAAASKRGRGNPLDIDGNEFQSERYLDKLRAEADLGQLMQRENELTQQIKTLDSDMQTLVYENYNKFISATDTIRKMKAQMEDMESEMASLASNMDNITKSSSEISDTLAPRRERIHKLSSGHLMLKKLQFLFELPARLKQCVDMKSYTQAVHYYSKASNILHAYRNMHSFKGIYDECMGIVGSLKEQLLKDAEVPNITHRRLVEVYDLLLKLGHPAEELCENLLARARAEFEENRTKQDAAFKAACEERAAREADSKGTAAAEAGNASAGDAPGTSETPDQPGDEERVLEPIELFIENGNSEVLCDLAEWILSYQEILCPKAAPDPEEAPIDPTQASPRVKPQERMATNKLLTFIDEVLGKYLQVTREHLQAAVEAAMPVDVLVSALELLCSGMDKMHTLLPRANLSERTREEVVVDSVRHLCRSMCLSLRRRFSTQLSALDVRLGELVDAGEPLRLRMLVRKFAKQYKQDCLDALAALRHVRQSPLAGSHPYFQAEFAVRSVRKGVTQSLLSHVIGQLRDVASRDEYKDDPSEGKDKPAQTLAHVRPALALFASCLARFFKENFVATLLTSSVDQFPASTSGGEQGLTDSDEMTITRLQQDAGDVATWALRKFVYLQGSELAQDLSASLKAENWLACAEPKAVRDDIKAALEKMTKIDEMVGELFDDSEELEHSSSSRRKFSTSATRQMSGGMSSKVMSRIRKIFSERIEAFGPVEENRQAIAEGIIKIVLKGYCESVRSATFSKYGFQQMEVDCHELKRTLANFVVSERTDGLVGTLIGQIESNASHRCLDPVNLDPSIIEMICGRGTDLDMDGLGLDDTGAASGEPVTSM